MLENIFKGIFDTNLTTVISVFDFLICLLCSFIIGIILAGSYIYKARYTKSFVATLAILPAAVCVVIMMVNGNIGAGVAVAGAFSLIRFRSVPGTAKEIGAIFIAMAAGLVVGMGYLGFALLSSVIFAVITMVYSYFDFGSQKSILTHKTLNITIPENLDYTDVFDSVLKEYTSEYELIRVKTTNMGSMFRLTYNLTLKDLTKEKEFIDKLRCRNGNLEISVSKQETIIGEL